MNKLFHRLSTRILLGDPAGRRHQRRGVHRRQRGPQGFFSNTTPCSRRCSSACPTSILQTSRIFATENHIVSTDGKPFTQWNDKYHYVSLMVIRQNEGLCYNSFVSYNMTYTEERQPDLFLGLQGSPTYEYQLQLEDETCKVYFSGYFDQAYTSLRKAICGMLFVASFVTAFFLLFQKVHPVHR